MPVLEIVAPSHVAFLPHGTGAVDSWGDSLVQSARVSADMARFFFQTGSEQVSFLFPETLPEEPFRTALHEFAEEGIGLRILHGGTMPTASGKMINLGFVYSEKELILEILRAFSGEFFQEESLTELLHQRGWTEPDLVVLTGGNRSIGASLTWSISYSELYFSPLPWLAFTILEAQHAFQDFQGRKRRFGRV